MPSIDTKTARLKLEPAKKAYFRQIAPGRSLGYRRTVTGAGRWVVRRADGKGGNTVKNLTAPDGRTAVVADDLAPADGVNVMTFEQAQTAAGGPARVRGKFTVSDAVLHYLTVRELQGRDIKSSQGKADAWIFDNPIGSTPVCDLTREQVGEWLNLIAAKPIKERRMTETDPDKIAAGRRATANRNLTLLKSALNECYNNKVHGQKLIENDDAWRRLSPLGDASNIRTGWLNVFDAQRLERACDGCFRTLVKPLVTIFASAAMSDLVERSHYADIEEQMLDLLDRVDQPNLSGVRDNLEGRIHITDWTTSAHFLGAYSAMLPGVKRRNPLVVGNLIFAGEAFVQNLKKSPSQMTGAWESGRIAGSKILKKLTLAARIETVAAGSA